MYTQALNTSETEDRNLEDAIRALRSSLMRRIIVLVVSAAINAYTIPAVAADSTSNNDIDATRAHSATVRSQPANAAEACRAYAVSFCPSRCGRPLQIRGRRANSGSA